MCVLPTIRISVPSKFRLIHSSQFLLTQYQFGAIMDGPEHGSEPINVGWENAASQALEAKGGSDAGKLRRATKHGVVAIHHQRVSELDLLIKNSFYCRVLK